MSAIASVPAPDALILTTPLPLSQQPAAVYLAHLQSGSRRTMRQSLDAIARLLTQNQADALTLNWAALRYAHTAAIRAVLQETYASTTANKMLCALRRVLKEALRLGQMGADDYARAIDLPAIKGTRLLRGRALTRTEVQALLTVCTADATPAGVRDAALIGLLQAGLRRSEVVGLDLRDVDLHTGAITIRNGKGQKDRVAYLPAGAIEGVTDWVGVRGREAGALLYPVHRVGKLLPRRLSDQAVLGALIKRADQAGVAPFSPHDFRRTFITELLDAGVDIITVQQLVGHASATTTARYDRRGETAKRQAVALLSFASVPRDR